MHHACISAHAHDCVAYECVGNGRRHHMSKLHDIMLLQGAHGVCVLRALVYMCGHACFFPSSLYSHYAFLFKCFGSNPAH